ncbi:MAG: hypothetical protein P4L75_06595 [Clostridia bacterium]|nr:hypothetical protein [Clostridia bacterium]MDR3643445.1 hypothetical protein [Clostridia bacterium]
MIEVKILAGVCGFVTTVMADSEDQQTASLKIITDCPNYKPLETELTEADAFEECFKKTGEGTIYGICRKYGKHAACPVPCGIVKAVEAACGLALPRDALIEVKKAQP